MKSLAGRISKPIIGKLNKFSDWLMSYVLEPIRNTMNERVSKVKNNVNQIFNQTEKFKIEQKEASPKGYLKTYRINSVEGYDRIPRHLSVM